MKEKININGINGIKKYMRECFLGLFLGLNNLGIVL